MRSHCSQPASALLIAISTAALFACSPGNDPADAESTQKAVHSSTRADAELNGRWRILSLDDRPPAGSAEGERAPSLTFHDHSFGGTIGCNFFGGLGMLADGRYAIHGWSSDLMGCPGELAQQERSLLALFYARPSVQPLGMNRVRLEGDNHALLIERVGPNEGRPAVAGLEDLAGTSWSILRIDEGESVPISTDRFLQFSSSGAWRGAAACATLSGAWRSAGDQIQVERIVTTEQNCPKELARIDDSLAALMRSNPRYLVGPNGELLIAGGGHVLAGRRRLTPSF